jgi:lipoate---protein ligase
MELNAQEIKCLDLTLPSAGANLACDEALLDACEDGVGPQVLRFWEPCDYFVVVGYANQIQREVNVDACARENVPILRRCSGGGTVLLGPGCLNYALVLRFDKSGPLASISGTNSYVMERNRQALTAALGFPVTVRGFTDLAVNDLKFSGNAQRRKRRALVFHGTFLLNFDLDRIGRMLPMPSTEPSYRQFRSHQTFLKNLNIPSAKVKAALQIAWSATTPFGTAPCLDFHGG